MKPEWIVFWLVTAVKVLLIPTYQSTDFDVHRNWLSITHRLPLAEWYTENTSEWTLDYPPFFAWFEFFWSQFAGMFDPGMLVITATPYRSLPTLYFQRITVILSDIVLFWGIHSYASSHWPGLDDFAEDFTTVRERRRTEALSSPTSSPLSSSSSASMQERWKIRRISDVLKDLGTIGVSLTHPSTVGHGSTEGKGNSETRSKRGRSITSELEHRKAETTQHRRFFLMLLGFTNAGLLLLDHIHFQYNGFLFGVFLLSIAFIKQGKDLHAAVTFAVLLNLKHIFLYVAPVYFVYLLVHYCWQPVDIPFQDWEEFEKASQHAKRRFRWKNFMKIASLVTAIFAISFGPFLWLGKLQAIRERLFPFQRGLCHAYWAPNLWAIYSFLDVCVGKLSPSRAGGPGMDFPGRTVSSALTSGKVGTSVQNLPEIPPLLTFVLTLLAMAPALLKIVRRPHPVIFNSSLIYCSMCAFMLGFHVHEKAILLTILPLTLVSCDSVRHGSVFLVLSILGHYAQLPLIHTIPEIPVKLSLFLSGSLLHYIVLRFRFLYLEASRRIRVPKLLHTGERILIFGLVPLYLLTDVLLPLLLPRMEFLPLMLTSIYCSVGMLYCWSQLYFLLLRNFEIIESYSD